MSEQEMIARRGMLTEPEQMRDAEAGCVPCRLCGGSAIISDAGLGAGYYIRCSNSVHFRDSAGCLIADRRLGGWAYNVMDWWNRLHSTTLASRTPEGMVMVPREPTEAMIQEAVDNVGPIGCCSHSPQTARETWQAMIAAAPTPSGAE